MKRQLVAKLLKCNTIHLFFIYRMDSSFFSSHMLIVRSKYGFMFYSQSNKMSIVAPLSFLLLNPPVQRTRCKNSTISGPKIWTIQIFMVINVYTVFIILKKLYLVTSEFIGKIIFSFVYFMYWLNNKFTWRFLSALGSNYVDCDFSPLFCDSCDKY